MIFCACSAREEEQWRNRLLDCSFREAQRQVEDNLGLPPPYALLSLNMKSLGHVYRRSDNTNRSLAIQRAATIPRSAACQVIIRNTHASKDNANRDISPSDSISRSHSVPASNRVPVLAPRRVDRMRMEYQLASVWTKEVLPYPGMGAQRGENMIRNSASSIIRRLRGASISSAFTKRSTSVSSLADSTSEPPQDCVTQIDDHSPKRRPKLHGSKSLDVGLGMKEQTITDPRIAHASNISNSTAKAGFLRNKKVDGETTAPDMTTYDADRRSSDTGSAKTVRTKSNAVAGLFTALSTEGIKSWFHSAH